MAHITPTVGRIVLFRPGANDGIGNGDALAGIVTAVNEDGTINLGVFSANADFERRLNVPLMQEGEKAPEGSYAHWMDYQLGQAAKTERAVEIASIMAATAGVSAELAASMVQPTANAQTNEEPSQ